MNIVPIKDLKDTVKIEKMCKEANSPVFITKNGYGSLVVMDIEYYSNTMSNLEEARLLFEGLEDIKNNRLRDGDTVMKGLQKKYEL